eukprot:5897370-Prorocentrum_lima.AAC.1
MCIRDSSEAEYEVHVDRVLESDLYPRKRDLIARMAKGMVPTGTYLAYTLPEMEIKANQVHQMTLLCNTFMDIMGTFYESLYDQFSDKEVFYYSDRQDLPPLQNNQ